MGCCTSSQYDSRTSKDKRKSLKPFAELPTVQFVSSDCASIITFIRGKAEVRRFKAFGLSAESPTISLGDSIFGISQGLEGHVTFWELNNETPVAHPAPPLDIKGGIFLACESRLILVGATVAGNREGEDQPAPLLTYTFSKKQWKKFVKVSKLEDPTADSVHPVLLMQAGVCLQKGVNGNPDKLIFVGGEYWLDGKLRANDKILWLALSTLEYGTFSINLNMRLRAPQVATVGSSELIIAGGVDLKTKKKSLKATTVDLNANSCTALTPMKHCLASSNIAPISAAEYVIFYSWPRVCYFNKNNKVFIYKSIRKSSAFKLEGLSFKRRDSMRSDVSSAEELGGEIDSHYTSSQVSLSNSLADASQGKVVKQGSFKANTNSKLKDGEENKSNPSPTKKETSESSEDEASDSSHDGRKTIDHIGKLIKQRSEGALVQKKSPKREKPRLQTRVGFAIKKKSGNSSSEESDEGKPETRPYTASEPSTATRTAGTRKHTPKFATKQTKETDENYITEDVGPAHMKREYSSPIGRVQVQAKKRSSSSSDEESSPLNLHKNKSEGTRVVKKPQLKGEVIKSWSSDSSDGTGEKKKITEEDALKCCEVLSTLGRYEPKQRAFKLKLSMIGPKLRIEDLKEALKHSIPPSTQFPSPVFFEFFIELAEHFHTKPLKDSAIGELLKNRMQLNVEQTVKVVTKGLAKLFKLK